MARDAIAFITALGLGQADILGFSIGSFVAQEIALIRPAIIRRLVLASSAPQGAAGMSSSAPGTRPRSGARREAPGGIRRARRRLAGGRRGRRRRGTARLPHLLAPRHDTGDEPGRQHHPVHQPGLTSHPTAPLNASGGEETSVRRVLSSGAGEFLVPMGMVLRSGVLATAGARRPRVPQRTAPGILAAGMPESRAGRGRPSLARFRVPATWVFSLHVVQAGSARAAGGGRACPDSVQPSW